MDVEIFMKTVLNETPRLLRDRQVAGLLGISRSFVWVLVKKKRLPQPIRLSRKMTVWRLTDIQPVLDDPKRYFLGDISELSLTTKQGD